MNYHYKTTQVPNILLDTHLPQLTESELKILLTIIRQTYGWYIKRTKSRKKRARISHYRFIQKTGLSRRVITKVIKSLLEKKLITITDLEGQSLNDPKKRKGQPYLYYTATINSHKVTNVNKPKKPRVSKVFRNRQWVALVDKRN